MKRTLNVAAFVATCDAREPQGSGAPSLRRPVPGRYSLSVRRLIPCFALLVGSSCGSPGSAPTAHRLDGIRADLDAAVVLGVRAVEQRKDLIDSYALIAVQRVLGQRTLWLVTFKPKRLIEFDNPTLGGPTAAGGELYVRVDIATGESTFTFGE